MSDMKEHIEDIEGTYRKELHVMVDEMCDIAHYRGVYMFIMACDAVSQVASTLRNVLDEWNEEVAELNGIINAESEESSDCEP